MAGRLRSGRLEVAVPGTAEPLSSGAAVSVAARRVTVAALSTNTQAVSVGGSDVIAAALTRRGIPLLAASPPITVEGIDELGDVFVDVIVAGEGVSFIFAED